MCHVDGQFTESQKFYVVEVGKNKLCIVWEYNYLQSRVSWHMRYDNVTSNASFDCSRKENFEVWKYIMVFLSLVSCMFPCEGYFWLQAWFPPQTPHCVPRNALEMTAFVQLLSRWQMALSCCGQLQLHIYSRIIVWCVCVCLFKWYSQLCLHVSQIRKSQIIA